MSRQRFYILLPLLMLAISACRHKESHKDPETDKEIAPVEALRASAVQDTVVEAPRRALVSLSASSDELIRYMKESEDRDRYGEGIIPAIAAKSEKYAARLLRSEYDRFIIVDKGRMKVILYDNYGREQKSYRMACARNYGTKHKKGDSRTPEGFFSVEGIYDSTDWLFTDDDGNTSQKKGQFGPRFIRLLIPGTSQIGIHGTCAPWSIGSRSSHGCIRITNEQILELVELVEPGMPVIVVPGRKDMQVNVDEDCDVEWIPSRMGAVKPDVKKSKIETADSINNVPVDTTRIFLPEATDSVVKEMPDTIQTS